MNLTTNFTLAEFERSSLAARNRIPNSVPQDLMQNVRNTALMLERIRATLSTMAGKDVPIHITSGYRCITLNRRLGSSDTSDHVFGFAADFVAPTFGSPVKICETLAPLVPSLGIGQLINEFPDTGSGWVHVSTRPPVKMINRIITITHNGVTPGIVRA